MRREDKIFFEAFLNTINQIKGGLDLYYGMESLFKDMLHHEIKLFLNEELRCEDLR